MKWLDIFLPVPISKRKINQRRKKAAIQVTARPIRTGIRFFAASFAGGTLQMAATGTTAQGIMVPPPTQIVVICPKAARVAAFRPVVCANVVATDPTSGRPEKPDPSSPVRNPINSSIKMIMPLFIGT